MESVSSAVKNIFRKLCLRIGAFVAAKALQIRGTIRLRSIKLLRQLIDRADEWCHGLEVLLRHEAAVAAAKAEVDPVASAARERAIKKLAGVSTGKSTIGNSASPHSRVLRPHRLPRLKYRQGEFVRSEASH